MKDWNIPNNRNDAPWSRNERPWSNESREGDVDWTQRSDAAPSAAPRRPHRSERPEDAPPTAEHGIVYGYNEKGYGFIEAVHNLNLSPGQRGKLRLFFHRSACPDENVSSTLT